MSLEFSGQITRSGFAGLAGRDLGGEREGGPDVVVEHGPALRVEVEAEPGHVALHDRDLDRPAVRRVQRHGEAERDDREPGDASRRPRRARRIVGTRRPVRSAGPAEPTRVDDAPRGSASRPPPATANVTSGAPPSAANRSAGESPWLNASRPHGKPPNGIRSRRASWPTQSTPVASGHIQRHGRPAGWRTPPAPRSARRRPPPRSRRISQGPVPPTMWVHSSSGTKNSSPVRPASRNPPQNVRRWTATVIAATANGASHHRLASGKDTSRPPPAAMASTAATAVGTPPSDAPVADVDACSGAVGAATTPVPPSASRSRAAVPVVELFVTAQLCLIEAECGVPRSTGGVLSVSSTTSPVGARDVGTRDVGARNVGTEKWNRGAAVAAAPRAPGPTSPTARHRVLCDLRTDQRWAGCPSLAVVYWPPHAVPKPCPATGAHHPCRPPPAGPGRCDVRLIVARPRAKRRANRSPMKLDPTTVRARPGAVSMSARMSISAVRRVASACLRHRLIARGSPR